MRFAIVSDVHANLEALRAVLARLGAGDRLFSLGDVVGYGPNPNECIELLRPRADAAVLGNHDLAAIDNYGLEYFNEAAREALSWTQQQLTVDNAAWLATLGYEHREPDYLLVHGAPVDYFRYVLDKRDAAAAFAATDAAIVFIGHTHVAESYALAADGSMTHCHYQAGGTLSLREGTRYIINVGSVGQPRDLNADASFAWYNDAERSVRWERVAYDIGSVQAKIVHACLPEVLATRLVRGR